MGQTKQQRQLKVLERCDAASRRVREERIIKLAIEQWHKDGEVEIAGEVPGTVSEGDDNGAYVMAWVWVEFAGTDLDKEKS